MTEKSNNLFVEIIGRYTETKQNKKYLITKMKRRKTWENKQRNKERININETIKKNFFTNSYSHPSN